MTWTKMGLSFDDVLIEPQFSTIQTRSEVDIGADLDARHHLQVPVISSPMDTVTETAMAVAMRNSGGLGIIHRYNTIEKQVDIIDRLVAEDPKAVAAAAIGVTGDYEERAWALYDAGARVLCIDVAHGHHVLMKQGIENIRRALGDEVHIMAGNVATLQATNDLADWGANSVRIGIGGGSICSTRIQTGHGIPTFQSVYDCAKTDRDVVLIADGGIKNSGDIVKSLAAGADFVMVGSLLAGTMESPGEVHRSPTGEPRKQYRGMASAAAQVDWRGKASSLEGISTTIPYKGSVKPIMEQLANGIRSGFSYSGARTVKQFQAKVKFIRQTHSAQVESSTHILREL